MGSVKVLVVGASGFIGRRVSMAFSPRNCVGTYCHTPIAHGVHFDACVERLGDRFLRRGHGLTHAVLAHGLTSLNQCAREPDQTAAVNVIGTERMIDDLVDAGVHPILLSHDGVFDGSPGPRSEEDAPGPILAYGRQKLAVEEYLKTKGNGSTILRLCRVVARFAHERNLLSKWLDQIARSEPILCATDQRLTPVDIEDVVQIVRFFVNTGVSGLYHVAGSEVLTRHELLTNVLEQLPRHYRRWAVIKSCRLQDIPSVEPLPLDCSLANYKLREMCGFAPAPMATVCRELCGSALLEAV
jgi:dTDP-4-dehydrorhamnose reductase